MTTGGTGRFLLAEGGRFLGKEQNQAWMPVQDCAGME